VSVQATPTYSMYDTNFHPALFVSHLRIRQAFSESMRPKKRAELPRRKSEGGEMLRVQPSTSFLSLPRRRFKRAITTTLAVIRFKSSLEKKSKEDENDAVPPTPTGRPQFCTRCHRAFDFSKAPVVVSGCFTSSNFLSTYDILI